MSNRFFIFSALLTLILSACSETPSWVIPEEKMENLLYDVHLAESEVDNDYAVFNDSTRKRELFNAVFRKYDVTQAEFDTSLVWYASHLDIYVGMYERISKRYVELTDTLNAQSLALVVKESKAKLMWMGDSIQILHPFPSENKYTFRLDSSALFSYGDMYELRFVALGVNENFRPKVTFVWYGQDTVFVENKEIESNGTFVVYLRAIPGFYTKALAGSIRVPVGAPGSQLIIQTPGIYRYKEGYYPDTSQGANNNTPPPPAPVIPPPPPPVNGENPGVLQGL